MKERENNYSERDILIATRVGGAIPVHYELDYAGHHYDIFYEHGCVRVDKNRAAVFLQRIAQQDDQTWDDNETIAYLHWIKEAIRKEGFETLKLPGKDEMLHKE